MAENDSTVDPQALVGRTLGKRYLLVEVIASGAEGTVYLAHGIHLDKPVAVKVLQPGLAASAGSIERFRREARFAAGISHPNIVTVLDFGQTEDAFWYLVMEHVEGLSLAGLVRKEGAQPLPRVLTFMRQLVEALQALHAGGVAHGDVTSGNIVRQPLKGGGEQIKLVDFGLASRFGVVRASTPGVSGTPGYLAPEVIQGAAPSVAADIYSAGAVLYELLTGDPPFAGHAPDAIMENQLNAELVPPSLRRPGLPPALDALVARAMAREPAGRPDAPELRSALAIMGAGALDAADPLAPSGTSRRSVTLRSHVPVVRPRWTGESTPRIRKRLLRLGIGRAMRRGDIDQLIELYLGLAALLRDSGEPDAAVAELDEAVTIVTMGEGAGAASGPEGLWRLLLLQAEVQDARGLPAAARRTAAHAYRHADRVRSARGRRSAAQLARGS